MRRKNTGDAHLDLSGGLGLGRRGDGDGLDVLGAAEVVDGDALVGETHLGGEGGVWHPSGGGYGGGLLHHSVDLLEGEALGLRNEEVGEEEGEDAEGSPHEEDLGTEVGIALVGSNEVWGDDGNDAVPEPVGGGGETDTTGTNGDRKDFTNDDPGCRTPGHGEGGDEQADEGNHGGDGCVVVVLQLTSSDTNDTDNELADDHEEGTDDQDSAASELLHDVEGNGGGADVDQGGDERDEERVGDGFERGEEDGSKVEDEIDTSELLHHLEQDTDRGSAAVADALEDGTLEAVAPAGKVAGLGNDLLLVFVVGNDLGEFVLDIFRVDGLTTDGGEGPGRLV